MKALVQWLTYTIVSLAFLASAGGLIVNNIYRDPVLFKTAWLANDVVTLILLPLVLLVFRHMSQGDKHAHLIWLGLMFYFLYNYAVYLFGAVYNVLFLTYVALFTLSLYSLILGLVNVAGYRFFVTPAGQKIISIFLMSVAAPLAAVEISECIRFIFVGKEPEIPTLVLTLDLTLVIPNTLVAAWLLWRNNVWGIILSAMMLVKCFTYGLILVFGTFLIHIKRVGPLDPLLPSYLFITTGGILFLWILFQGPRSRSGIIIYRT